MPLVNSRAIHRIPLELWLRIFGYRQELSIRKVALAFNKQLPASDLKHSKVWDAIFDNYDWLNFMAFEKYHCMLFGNDLNFLYTSNTEHALLNKSSDINLVLICGEYWSPTKWSTSKFFKSLKKTASPVGQAFPDEATISAERPSAFPKEVTIPYGDNGRYTIRLDIRSLTDESPSQNIFIKKPIIRLFCPKDDGLHAAYIYWHYDSKKLRYVLPKDIDGVGRNKPQHGGAFYIVGLCKVTLTSVLACRNAPCNETNP